MRDNDKFWHLDQGVVDNAGDNVETVNDGERHEQLVERGAHLRTPEHLPDYHGNFLATTMVMMGIFLITMERTMVMMNVSVKFHVSPHDRC